MPLIGLIDFTVGGAYETAFVSCDLARSTVRSTSCCCPCPAGAIQVMAVGPCTLISVHGFPPTVMATSGVVAPSALGADGILSTVNVSLVPPIVGSNRVGETDSSSTGSKVATDAVVLWPPTTMVTGRDEP